MSNDSSSVSSEHDELFKVNSVEYIKNSDLKYDNDLENCIKQLSKIPNDVPKKDGCSYLIKILENILLDPQNLKTRRIRRSNKVFLKYISNNVVFVNLLLSFGFIIIEDFYVLQVVQFHRLVYAYNLLIGVLKDSFNISYRSLESHFFDPFKSYKHNSNVYANSDSFEIVSKDETKSHIDNTVKDISERDENESTLDDWSPVIKVENNSKGSRIQPVKADNYNPPVSSLIKMYNIGKNENFESKSKKELETLKAKSEFAKKCPVVEIKIKMPKSTTLTLQIPVKTLVSKIRQNIQSILVDDILYNDWHLVEFPIRRKINDDKTLLQEDIVFKSILHITFKDLEKNKIQIVKQEFLDKYQNN